MENPTPVIGNGAQPHPEKRGREHFCGLESDDRGGW